MTTSSQSQPQGGRSATHKKSSLQQREQFLIIFLIMTLLVGSYFIFRHKENNKTMAIATESLEQVQQDISSFEVIKPIAGSPRVEQAKIQKLTDKFTQISALIKTAEKDLVDLQDARAVERRWADVSNLISNNALFVLSRYQHEVDVGGVQPYLRGQEQESILQRPMQSIEINGQFSGFYKLLNEIKDLDWTLSVLKLELEIVEPAADPLINAKLILAI